jgi:hypothetical protein
MKSNRRLGKKDAVRRGSNLRRKEGEVEAQRNKEEEEGSRGTRNEK